MKGMAAFGLGIFLFMQPVSVAAGAPGDQVRQSVDKLLAILADPRLKQEGKKNEGSCGCPPAPRVVDPLALFLARQHEDEENEDDNRPAVEE